MVDLERFIEVCRHAAVDGESHKAVREIVARAVGEPIALLSVLGEPTVATIGKLYHDPDLTILNTVWAPQMTVMPHDHRMWAVIGVYAGGEDNIFWRRDGHKITAAGARALREGDAVPLGKDIVHSVTNPTGGFTGASMSMAAISSARRAANGIRRRSRRGRTMSRRPCVFADANARHVASRELRH